MSSISLNSTPTVSNRLSSAYLYHHYSQLAIDCKRAHCCEAAIHYAHKAQRYAPPAFGYASLRALRLHGPARLATGRGYAMVTKRVALGGFNV